jgi:hypothetical protein
MQRNNPSELRALWPSWADFLRRLGLENLAAWALEAAGPLTALSAQALYLGEPFLRPAFSNAQVGALARLLEDDEEARAFLAFLREEGKA